MYRSSERSIASFGLFADLAERFDCFGIVGVFLNYPMELLSSFIFATETRERPSKVKTRILFPGV